MPALLCHEPSTAPFDVGQLHLKQEALIASADVMSRLSQQARTTAGPHLYDGSSGLAIFFAAFHAVTEDNDARRLAIQSIAPLAAKMRALRTAAPRVGEAPLAIGGMVGLGSFVYTFTRLAGWFHSSELLEYAYASASLITEERIQADKHLDVMTGAAGTLLGLLALHATADANSCERDRALDMAFCCGRHLLESRVPYRSGPRAWPGLDRPPLSGFAHGAAGISYALSRLYAATGQPEFRDAALEGFAFERHLYNARTNRWLDTRFGRPLEQSAWCHGAPGMALARAHSLSLLHTPDLRKDIEIALAATRASASVGRDHLCCGASGHIEILHSVGVILRKPELIDDAWQFAARMLIRAAGSDFTFADDTECDSSLFHGLAGVGYTLLRFAASDRLPCLLVLE